MKKLSTLVAAAVAAVALLLSASASARYFVVVNTAPYKMVINAHYYGGGHKVWYCPAQTHCRLNHFPRHIKRVVVSRYSNPHKRGFYPNGYSHTPNHPFNNKRIKCINRRHSSDIDCHVIR
jgi:hypothetical protein